MAQDASEVLVGVATLSIREPNDAIAEWSTTQRYAGDYSVRLYKGGSGNDGSTHIEVTLTPSATITITTFDADPTDYSFWYWYQNLGQIANWVQYELRFEDPNSDAWVEVTVVPHQSLEGTGAWLQKALALTDNCGFGGVGELGASFFDWDLGTTIADLVTDIDTEGAVTDCGDWQLARVRLEIWEATPERTAYVDSLEIDGTAYTIEPGGTGPAMSLSSPFVTVGYTEDGVTFTYTGDTADIEVEEETLAIGRVLTKETVEVTCNMAQSSLANLNFAIGGGVLSGNILTIGGGVLKTMNLKVEGVDPAGFKRAYHIPKATAMGAVGMSYRKGEKTVVPVTFQALKSPTGSIQLVDNTA